MTRMATALELVHTFIWRLVLTDLQVAGLRLAGTITATINSKTSYVVADIKTDYEEIGDRTSINASVGEHTIDFVPKMTAAYYIYSSSGSSNNPYGHLYDADGEVLTINDDDKQEHISTGNDHDFYMSYNCEAGKVYYINVTRNSSMVYITTEYPGKLRWIPVRPFYVGMNNTQ